MTETQAAPLTGDQAAIVQCAAVLDEVLRAVVPANVVHYAVEDARAALAVLDREIHTIHTSDWVRPPEPDPEPDPRHLTLADLPMGGCINARVHAAHLAAGDTRCDNENPPRLSVKETAAAIRKALKHQWPGVKFSLTMSSGTGYGYLDASWVDGPTSAAFHAFTDAFRDQRFDGMDDGHHAVNQGTRYNCNGVNGQRRFSQKAMDWALHLIGESPGLYERDGDHLVEQTARRVAYSVDFTTDPPTKEIR